MPVALETPPTAVAVARLAVDPSPIWPFLLKPQHFTVPSA
jgi:hypothetical protein